MPSFCWVWPSEVCMFYIVRKYYYQYSWVVFETFNPRAPIYMEWNTDRENYPKLKRSRWCKRRWVRAWAGRGRAVAAPGSPSHCGVLGSSTVTPYCCAALPPSSPAAGYWLVSPPASPAGRPHSTEHVQRLHHRPGSPVRALASLQIQIRREWRVTDWDYILSAPKWFLFDTLHAPTSGGRGSCSFTKKPYVYTPQKSLYYYHPFGYPEKAGKLENFWLGPALSIISFLFLRGQ